MALGSVLPCAAAWVLLESLVFRLSLTGAALAEPTSGPKEELTVVLMDCASPQARGHMRRQLIATLVYAHRLEN